MGILVLLITVGWMVQTIRQGAGSAPIVYGYIHPANFAGVKAEMRPQALAGELPSVYQCGTTTDRQNIPFNLIGWNFNNAENPCLVGQSTILFFGPFECLSLLVEDFPVNQPGRSQSFSPASVRVQASASLLQRESLIRLDDNLYQLQFCRDRLTLKQRQWNSVVIGWVEPDNLAEGRAPLRLLRAAINRGSLPEQTSAGASQ
ncbi:MAG: hypothetical protein DHS20C01_36030 [marine bacterium B5-7]|nr:MAG: hypothetical protein DHS20C01_36030 [marine bacterium B5-7]